MEKGGTRFMNVRESDVRKRRTGAIIAAVTAIGLFVILLGVILWANKQDPAPQVILWLMFMIIGSMIIGTILALLQRLKEVQKGEIDEASKY
jgi:phosphatidylglycerophosphate synthase